MTAILKKVNSWIKWKIIVWSVLLSKMVLAYWVIVQLRAA